MPPAPSGRLLSVAEAAERLGTGERFIRRLIAERRIAFVKVGRHVRIADSVLAAYIEANTVEPARRMRSRYGKAA
ncbi:excisionase family DNA-binding protein [Streptomyces abikoensis]